MNKQTTNKRIINCGGAIQKHTQSGKRDKRIVVARDDGGIREGHRFEVFFFFFIRYILEGVYSVFAADGTEKAQ